MATDSSWLHGRWESTETGTPHLVFAASGEVRGSDGCNRIASAYVCTEHGARITPFLTTQMACLGVDPWLGAVREVRPVGEELAVLDGGGHELGRLRHAAE